MDALVFVAALSSAILHACWNAAIRGRTDPGDGVGLMTVGGFVVAVPALFIIGLPDQAAWGWLAGGTLFGATALRLLMAANRRAPFAVAFPISRGFIPPIMALAAAVVSSEVPPPQALAGIGVISAALLLLAVRTLRRGETPISGVMLAAASGVFAAGAGFMDAQGVRAAGDVLAYGFALALVNGILVGAMLVAEGRPPWRQSARDWRFGLLASVVSFVSYFLILYAFLHGPTGPVSALRETSLLFATGLATWKLGERVGRTGWVAVLVAVSGVALLRLA